MNEEIQALFEFLHHRYFRYSNPAGINFYRIADGSFYVAAGYPGVEETADIALDFFQQFDHLTQFMALLHYSDPERLADILPQDLLSLYDNELLDIVCILKGRRPREMSFRKLGGLIWASSARKKMHQVKMQIQKPEDFIAYTMRHYRVIGNERSQHLK